MPARKQRGFSAILIVILFVILAVAILGGIYYTKREVKTGTTDSQELESTQGNYTNAKWKFSLAIPEGYLVQGDDTLLHVTKKPTADNETPSPEMNIKIGQGSKTTVDNSAEIKVISQEAVSINNIGGHKIVVSYKSYPEGNKCPIYRLHHSGVVYEFSLYECLGSDIFETVVGSFNII